MTKRVIALILVLVTLAALLAACKSSPSNDVIDIGSETPAPEATAEPGSVDIGMAPPSGIGMAAAGSVHSIGLRTDGTVLTAGHNTAGQNSVGSWNDIVFIAACDELSAAVTATGTVLIAGNGADALKDCLAWTDIAKVAVGTAHIIGLKNDGTLVAAGDNSASQCNVTGWTDVVDIAAAGKHSVALHSDGHVSATGDNAASQCNVTDWTAIVAIDAGDGATAGLKSDGTAVSTRDDVSAFSGIKAIACSGNMTVGITEAGGVVCAPDNPDAAAITDASKVAAGKAHAIVIKTDGSAVGIGSDDDFQCSVSSWLLDPYEENGALLGFAPGMSVARVEAITADFYGAETAIKKDGADMLDTDIIVTGAELYVGGTLKCPVAIRGDVNGDGIINASDSDEAAKHFDGSAALTGAYLAAASVNLDSSGNADATSADAIMNYAMGVGALSQFRLSDASIYADKIAAAKAKNSDVVGWIAIEGTNIDYPILFSKKDQWYYNERNIDKEEIASGSIYPYFNQYVQNNVVTGHNSRTSLTMFHELHHVQEYNMGKTNCAYKKCSAELTNALPDFSTYKGRIFTVNLYGVEAQYEVFSMYENEAGAKESVLLYNTWYPPSKYWKDSDEDIQEWIDTQIDKSDYDFGVKPTTDETFMTIFTCGNEHDDALEQARLYFFLHKVS